MMLRDYLGKAPVYVVAPLDVIRIRRISHPRKKRELEMIVRIDEPREYQEPAQVDV